MRILVKTSKLFNGFGLLEDVDLTIENGIVLLGRKAGDYDLVLEADTVTPGFIDTHVHIVHDTRPGFFARSLENVIALFIMHGVIGVRDTGNYMSIGDLVESLNRDFLVVRTFTVEKPPLSWLFMRMINGPQDLHKAVETAYIEGCKWFKLYDNVDEEIAKQAVIEAHNRGLKITCHVTGFGLLKAIEYGFDAIEHLASIVITKPGIKLVEGWESIDEGLIEELAIKLCERNIAVSTTLALLRSVADKLRIDIYSLSLNLSLPCLFCYFSLLWYYV